jgi:uncharacterized metal-binding protein YceD (DUF177 family)
MGNLNPHIIDLKALQADTETFQCVMDDKDFETIEAPEIRKGHLEATITVHKKATSYELDFKIKGCARITCDRCLDEMEQPIDAEGVLKVKFGKELNDDGEVLEIPEDDGTIDVAWYIYEFAALAIPIRHTHPEGSCNLEMDKALKAHETADDNKSEDESKGSDPRWEGLKKLLENNQN